MRKRVIKHHYNFLAKKHKSMNGIALKNLVLLGGGHAHAHVIKMMGMNPIPGVQVTLITKDVETPYSGMIPGYVAGKYTRDECHLDLEMICSWSKVSLIHAEAYDIDTVNKKIKLIDYDENQVPWTPDRHLRRRKTRPPISYDVLSIDIGITPSPYPHSFANITNGDNRVYNITAVKPIDGFAKRWDATLARLAELSKARLVPGAPAGKTVRIAMVGGGAGGCELSMVVHSRLQPYMHDNMKIEVCVVSRATTLLSGLSNPRVQKVITRLMGEKGIVVHTGSEVVDVVREVDSDGEQQCFLVDTNGKKIPYDEAIWCTQGTAAKWLMKTGLQLGNEIVASNLSVQSGGEACKGPGGSGGFICVGPTLESVNIPGIFACGDCCHMVESPRPKAGVFAVRAGPPLTENLRRKLLQIPLEKWTPQTDFLGIIYCGNEYAVASRGALAVEGAHQWRLKDTIDRNWMAMYQVLPPMDEAAMLAKAPAPGSIPDIAYAIGDKALNLLAKKTMRCGGCGSKVGSQVLTRALKRIKHQIPTNSSVIAGVGDDAALVRAPIGQGEDAPYLVHTVDYVKSFVTDPFIFGQITALHSLSDLHAMNGVAVSALALCVVPYGPEEMVEDSLVQVLAGAAKVLAADRDDDVDMEIRKRWGGEGRLSEGCALVGGHTSEGTELALGFAINGVAAPNNVLHKGSPSIPRLIGGVLLHDVIILTKPLGTGTLLAANMRGLARAKWIEACTKNMLLSNKRAARIIASATNDCNAEPCGPTSQHRICCTDVTGFGLLGHLIEMLKYDDGPQAKSESEPLWFEEKVSDGYETDEDVERAATQDLQSASESLVVSSPSASSRPLPAAVLTTSKIPLMFGAPECIEKGVFSTLHPQNLRCKHAVQERSASNSKINTLPVFPLLFDPQTSGGLLATIPGHHAERVIRELRAYGYPDSTIIGHIEERNPATPDVMVYLED